MSDCIFCKIVDKEIPAEIVYEDDTYIAFMDITPMSVGHVQVIPKEHYRWVWDQPEVGPHFEIVKKVALAQKKAFNTDIVWSHVEGKEVPHAHIWVFPDPETPGDKTDFKGNAERIREAI